MKRPGLALFVWAVVAVSIDLYACAHDTAPRGETSTTIAARCPAQLAICSATGECACLLAPPEADDE